MSEMSKIITSEKIKTVLHSLNDSELKCLKQVKVRIQYVNSIIKQMSAPLPEGHYLLLSKDGIFQRFHLLDNNLVVIGRNKDSHIVIDSPHISRLHCIIDKNNMIFELRDMNSRNGVTVNYERVQKRALCDGDVITIGKVDVIYFISKPPENF